MSYQKDVSDFMIAGENKILSLSRLLIQNKQNSI